MNDNDNDNRHHEQHIDIGDLFVEKEEEQLNRHKDEAPGCHITNQDIPLIIASIAGFLAFFVYGACLGSLGAALPELAIHYYKTEEEFSSAFTARGIGYFVGTFSSAVIIEIPKNKFPLLPLVCVALLLLGAATIFLSLVNHYTMILIIFSIQGVGAAGVDTFGNCLLPALWDVRVSPWMQTMHSFFGVGSVLGPALVGSLGYSKAFIILGITSISPIVLLAFYGCVTGITGYSAHFHQTGNSNNHPSSSPSSLTSVKHNSDNQYGKLSVEDSNDPSSAKNISNNSSNNTMEDGGLHMKTSEIELSSSSSSFTSSHSNTNNISPMGIRRRQEQQDNNNNNGSNNDNTDKCTKDDVCDDKDTDGGDGNDTDNDSHINTSHHHTLHNNNNNTSTGAYSFSIPWSVRILITLFLVIYSGIETSYGGWISSYAIEKHVANTEEKAALVESYYWAASTVGRIIAIPLAVFISATRMIRMQLILCLIGSVLVMTIASQNYNDIIIASVVFGYALSSIQAIAMTFVTDYGYIMDATTTTLFVVGSTLGEAGIPILVGFIFDLGGPTTLQYSIFICTVSIILLYLVAHGIAKTGSLHLHRVMKEMHEQMHQQVVEPIVNTSSSSIAMVVDVSTQVSTSMNNKMTELTEKIGITRSNSTSTPTSKNTNHMRESYDNNSNANSDPTLPLRRQLRQESSLSPLHNAAYNKLNNNIDEDIDSGRRIIVIKDIPQSSNSNNTAAVGITFNPLQHQPQLSN